MCEVYDWCIVYECCRDFTTGQDPEQAGGFRAEIEFRSSKQKQIALSKKAPKKVFYSLAVCCYHNINIYIYIYIYKE